MTKLLVPRSLEKSPPEEIIRQRNFFLEIIYLCGVPGDQLLQNLPRAEMQQGYVVVAVCSAHFYCCE